LVQVFLIIFHLVTTVSEGQVLDGPQAVAGIVGHHRGAGEVVVVGVLEVGALAQRHQLAAEVVVGGHHAGGRVLLVVLVDVEDGLAVLRLHHPVAVAVVNERGAAGDGHQLVCHRQIFAIIEFGFLSEYLLMPQISHFEAIFESPSSNRF
jgi:hypothetical protein